MDHVDQPKSIRPIVYVALFLILIGAAAALGLLAVTMADCASEAVGEKKAYYSRLALASAAALGIVALMLVWVAIRFVAFRLRSRKKPSHTRRPSAWATAGKRFRLTEADEEKLESDWADE